MNVHTFFIRKTIGFLVVAALVAVWFVFFHNPKQAQVPEENGNEMCIQVITDARSPETGEVETFPTPCDVPEGWDTLETDHEEFTRDGQTWTRYRNDDLGIRFEYRIAPDGYLLIEHEGIEYPSDDVIEHVSLFNKEEYLELVTSSVPREGPPGITIMVFDNPEGYSAREWAEEETTMSNYRTDSPSVSELEEIDFSGVSAVRYTYDGLYTNDTIVALNNNRIYFISGGYFDENSAIRQDFLEMLDYTSLY